MDEGKVSTVPKSGADYEQSECSTDPKKRHLHVHYQTYTATKIWREKKRSQTSLHKKIENKICNSCFCCSLPFVCKERHSREHQLHTSPLPALEPQLSSKRDPYKALLLHTILDPPETAVPVVLKHKRPNSFTKEPCGQL